MIEALKPYPKYKDSAVPWLGEVPEHWDVCKLKYLARMQSGENITSYAIDETGDYPVYGGGGLRGYTSEYNHDGHHVLIGRQGALCGNINYAKGKFWASEHAVVAHLRSEFPAVWFGELLRAMNLNQYSQSAAQPGLAVERIQNLLAPIPPVDECKSIVRFLEVADRRIQKYIRAKQRLIALLNEQKQAIIQRAVTQGLNPDTPKKPSGIPWLGDIPAHWEVKRAKYFYQEVDERSKDGSEELLSVSHITGVTPRRLKNITMFMATSYAGHKLCRSGDLVINTMWAWMAALGVSEHMGIVSPSYAVYRPILPNEFHPRYIDALMRTRPYVAEYVCRSTGIRSSRLRLYPERFLTLPIICPPREEQDKIVTRFETATAEMDRAIASAESEIRLLREYRTRLIADVVTGKLDVRKAAAALPIGSVSEDEELSQDSSAVLDEEAESVEVEYA